MAMIPLAQSRLGDDDEREARRTALLEEVQDKLGRLGDKGITNPKDALLFVRNLQSRLPVLTSPLLRMSQALVSWTALQDRRRHTLRIAFQMPRDVCR